MWMPWQGKRFDKDNAKGDNTSRNNAKGYNAKLHTSSLNNAAGDTRFHACDARDAVGGEPDDFTVPVLELAGGGAAERFVPDYRPGGFVRNRRLNGRVHKLRVSVYGKSAAAAPA